MEACKWSLADRAETPARRLRLPTRVAAAKAATEETATETGTALPLARGGSTTGAPRAAASATDGVEVGIRRSARLGRPAAGPVTHPWPRTDEELPATKWLATQPAATAEQTDAAELLLTMPATPFKKKRPCRSN